MQQLSIEKLEQLHDVHLRLHEAAKDLATINSMMEQLTQDNCSCTISFLMHNNHTCQQQKQLSQLAVPVHKQCTQTFSFSTGESPGIRILHAIKQERQMLVEELRKTMEQSLNAYIQ